MASDQDGPLAETALNKQAGEWLRAVRKERKRSGPRFADALSDVLRIKVSPGALYAWEGGTRTVPAAVLLAASQITSRPIATNEGAKQTLTDEVAEAILARLRARGLDV